MGLAGSRSAWVLKQTKHLNSRALDILTRSVDNLVFRVIWHVLQAQKMQQRKLGKMHSISSPSFSRRFTFKI
jgi:hypothetical protein